MHGHRDKGMYFDDPKAEFERKTERNTIKAIAEPPRIPQEGAR